MNPFRNMTGPRTDPTPVIVPDLDKSLLIEPDPDTRTVIRCKELGMTFPRREPLPLEPWPRGAEPGGQPDTSGGQSVWLMIETPETKEDKLAQKRDLWHAGHVLYGMGRNKASRENQEAAMDPLLQFLKSKAFFGSGAFLAFGCIVYLLKLLN